MGMRERAGHFGGTLMIDSVPGHGTLVRLTGSGPRRPEAAAKGAGQPGARAGLDVWGSRARLSRSLGQGAWLATRRRALTGGWNQ